MAELGWLSEDEAKSATAEPLDVRDAPEPTRVYGYFVEEVRRELIGRYGEKAVYEGGLTIRTSYAPVTQRMPKRPFAAGCRIRPAARLARPDRAAGQRGGGRKALARHQTRRASAAGSSRR